ncbi:MAG: hypothetical protein SCM11_18735 [Bacillota bacterium]|nr:hypothetical protein [Bacillota bacterium]
MKSDKEGACFIKNKKAAPGNQSGAVFVKFIPANFLTMYLKKKELSEDLVYKVNHGTLG